MLELNFETLKLRLLQHLQHLIRVRDPYLGHQGHFYVKEYLRMELEQWGKVKSHWFEVRGKRHENLILDLPAQKGNSENVPILIGAHYDTVPSSPGADDNASGLAVLLEIAHFFQENPLQYPLQLVAFDMEEYGLLGSQAYAQYLKQNKQPLHLMMSLEMLGYCDSSPQSQIYPPGLKYLYPNQGNFIALVSNFKSFFAVRKISQQIRNYLPCQCLSVPLNGWLVWDTRRSDHAPFWDQGYKAILVTDTANLRNPHYHRSTDTLNTLDLDFLTNVCLGLMTAINTFKS